MATLMKLWRGQTLLRIRMNEAFSRERVGGVVVDVGGGRHPDYFDHFKREGVVSITPVDASISGIDFERDALPFAAGHADTLVCANLLEHIYNYQHLCAELRRVLKPGGTLVGFVPFLMQYHPDPHDYFRYTKEALSRIFADAGFSDVRITRVGGGPFTANFNNLALSVPRVFRVVLYPFYAALDTLFLALRPLARERYPLGFVFVCR